MKSMYKQLNDEEKDRLQVYWYTGKDQDRPINAHLNQRNCHVKLMIVDGIVGIQGNGNQDAQSWFHSQEINIMIDCPSVCKEWRDGIRKNENTHLYGRLQNDGIWRDKDGKEATDGTGVHSGISGLYKGVKGSILRVQGKGGF
jgi:phosphatidylserine/phosphatidylglycerophosphate/cardiolipin synthase-like enzyme